MSFQERELAWYVPVTEIDEEVGFVKPDEFREQFFLVSDRFPDELEYSFWVGPSCETQARAFKAECGGQNIIRTRDKRQAAQEAFELPFTDQYHEDFYQYCTNEDSDKMEQVLQGIISSYTKRYEKALGDLEVREGIEQVYKQEREQNSNPEYLQDQLNTLEEQFNEDVKLINEKIQGLHQQISTIQNKYESDKQRIEDSLQQLGSKKQKTEGLYCAHCHLPLPLAAEQQTGWLWESGERRSEKERRRREEKMKKLMGTVPVSTLPPRRRIYHEPR